jgi:hypothetical protein
LFLDLQVAVLPWGFWNIRLGNLVEETGH